jgi:hypothetical protein
MNYIPSNLIHSGYYADLIQIINDLNSPECEITQLEMYYNKPLLFTISKKVAENGNEVIKIHQAIVLFDLETYKEFVLAIPRIRTEKEIFEDLVLFVKDLFECAQTGDYKVLAEKIYITGSKKVVAKDFGF